MMCTSFKRGVTKISFDTSIKERGKKSPSIFNIVMKITFVSLQGKWRAKGMGWAV